tara:strand:+ start:7503 stop:7937 length:435 start_codon:yes stop_codon:yes gene_type:complete
VEIDRNKAVADALAFFERERAISSIQEKLREYRGQGMLAHKDNSDMWSRVEALETMDEEDHRPKDMLEQNMRAEGVPKPSAQHPVITPALDKANYLTSLAWPEITCTFTVYASMIHPMACISLLKTVYPHWNIPTQEVIEVSYS